VEKSVLVVGLGNPGPRYANTRHNFGFMVLDALASEAGFFSWQGKFSGEFLRFRIGEHSVLLLKPQAFMNLSGRSVSRAAEYFRVDKNDIIVIHDDLDLEFGRILVKKGGGIAGHKGLASIKQELGNSGFVRVRMGIGRPPFGDVAKYVLNDFAIEETRTLVEVVKIGIDIVNCIVCCDAETAMNRYNNRGGKE
jgi:PTH1 family peptidyl-tRNA hydrolase